jgi:hypothetical protein
VALWTVVPARGIENFSGSEERKLLSSSAHREALVEDTKGVTAINAAANGKFQKWPKLKVERYQCSHRQRIGQALGAFVLKE